LMGKLAQVVADYLSAQPAYKKRYGKKEPMIITPWWRKGDNEKAKVYLSFGATEALDPTEDEVADRLRADSSLRGFDWSIVTTGQSEALKLGVESIRPGGTACIVGLARQGAPVPVDMLDLVVYERTIVGSAYGTISPQLLVPQLIELYRRGRLPLERLISDRFTLEQIDTAFSRSRDAEGLRSVLQIAQPPQP